MHPQLVAATRQHFYSQAIIDIPSAGIIDGDNLLMSQVLANGSVWVSWRVALQLVRQCLSRTQLQGQMAMSMRSMWNKEPASNIVERYS